MTIKGIRLITGDELVAKVVQENPDGSIVISDALLMSMQIVQKSKDNPDGGLVCNFYPWTIINSGDITLQPQGFMAHYDVPADVERSYIQNTSNLAIVDGAAASQILHG